MRYQQLNQSDCGIVCLEYLFNNIYHIPIKRTQIMNEIKYHSGGITLYSIVELLNKYECEARAYKCNDISFIKSLPSILLLQEKYKQKGHFVLLLNINKKHISVFDPYYGKVIKIKMDMLLTLWQGVFIEIKKNDSKIIKIEEENKETFRVNNFGLIICEILEIGLQLLTIIIFTTLYKLNDLLLILTSILLLLLSFLVLNLKLKLFSKNSDKTNHYLEKSIINKLFFLPYYLINRFSNSDLYTRFIEVFKYRKLITSNKINVFVALTFLILGHSLLLYLSLYWGIICLIYNLVNFIIAIFMNLSSTRLNAKLNEIEAKIYEQINFYIINKDMIKINNYEDKFFKNYTNNLHELYELEAKLQFKNSYTEHFKNILNLLMICLIIISKDISKVMYIIIFQQILSNLWNYLINHKNVKTDNQLTIKRIDEIRGYKLDSNQNETIYKIKSIKINHLTFGYSSNLIYQDFNQEFKGITYLHGDNGSGKTTLLNLIMGLNQNYDGQIQIDDLVLNQENYYSYKNHFSYLNASSLIIKGTLRDNLLLGSNLSQAELMNLLDKYNLLDLLNGHDLNEDIDQNSLSNGEKQIINIIRVILNPKPILIIDEGLELIDRYKKKMILDLLIDIYQDRILILTGLSLIDYINEGKIYIFDLNNIKKVYNYL
jgi:ABC-type bacteriocin/lantibiotic exporter with double-glycine peptidase domain